MSSTNQTSWLAKLAVKLKGGDQGSDNIQDPHEAQLEFDGLNPNNWVSLPEPEQRSIPINIGIKEPRLNNIPIWHHGGDTQLVEKDQSEHHDNIPRIPSDTPFAFRLLPRACKTGLIKKTPEWSVMADHLGLSKRFSSTPNSRFKAVIVGISAINCEPVIMLRQTKEEPFMAHNVADNMDSVMLRSRSGETSCGREVIWFESMLIPGNIAFAKRALHHRLHDEETWRLTQTLKREHTIIEKGLNPSGIMREPQSGDTQQRKPSVCRPIHDGVSYDKLHYRLRWPPIAVLDFPPKMVKGLQDFLAEYPTDKVPINVALAATIIYFDMRDQEGPEEGFAAYNPNMAKIRPAPLGLFIMYFSHMLRFVEVKRLTAFIHPSRFATTNSGKDCSDASPLTEAGRFRVNSRTLDTKAMRECYYDIRSRHPQVPLNFRFNLIPASMPGTSLIFPEDCHNAEKPSLSLFTLCGLNDVRTLGLPSYHYTDSYVDHVDKETSVMKPQVFRHVAGPRQLFSKGGLLPCYECLGTPLKSYWQSKRRTKFMALTGNAKAVGPIFPDIGSDYWESEAITECVEQHFGVIEVFTADDQFCKDLSEPRRVLKASRNDQIIRIANYLGVPSSEWYTNPKTLCVTWVGMEDQLRDLSDKGELKEVATGELQRRVTDELKRVASQDHPLPSAKRIRVSEHVMDTGTKTQILNIISELPALSLDWFMLQRYLNMRPSPEVRFTQDLLSDVQAFVSDVENTFKQENAENGQGNLDAVIRTAFRAAGFYDSTKGAPQNIELSWTQHHNSFSQFGQPTANAMELIYRVRDFSNGFALTLPSIQVLRDSSLISAQVDAYNKIVALLDGQMAKE
jgi:hypothetical protein